MNAVDALFARTGLVLIAGPCVIEGRDFALRHAEAVRKAAGNTPVIFKSSFDKANRTSVGSFRGPGLQEGLRILEEIRQEMPVLTDIHSIEQCVPASQAVDVIQIPAFLCRQTDLIAAAARTGTPLNIKKGQFLAPEDMKYAVQKAQEVGGTRVCVTERGATFGYRDLVVDMRSILTLGTLGVPVVYDATHSVQQPGAAGGKTGGNRLLAGPLARAAVAVGVDAIFAEVHEDPDNAKSDGPNCLTFPLLQQLLHETTRLDAVRRSL